MLVDIKSQWPCYVVDLLNNKLENKNIVFYQNFHRGNKLTFCEKFWKNFLKSEILGKFTIKKLKILFNKNSKFSTTKKFCKNLIYTKTFYKF